MILVKIISKIHSMRFLRHQEMLLSSCTNYCKDIALWFCWKLLFHHSDRKKTLNGESTTIKKKVQMLKQFFLCEHSSFTALTATHSQHCVINCSTVTLMELLLLLYAASCESILTKMSVRNYDFLWIETNSNYKAIFCDTDSLKILLMTAVLQCNNHQKLWSGGLFKWQSRQFAVGLWFSINIYSTAYVFSEAKVNLIVLSSK